MLQQVIACDTTNPIHSAKLTRIGELHASKAKSFNAKVKAHVISAKRELNDCKTKGAKNLSRAIGGQRAKPLTCVCRDRDTNDGGKTGQITTDPQEVDAVVKRAWQLIYNGVNGCIKTAVDKFLSTYNDCIGKCCNSSGRRILIPCSSLKSDIFRERYSSGILNGHFFFILKALNIVFLLIPPSFQNIFRNPKTPNSLYRSL